MIFTRFYLTQGQNLETQFVLPASREYFGVEPTTFLSTNLKKRIHWYNEMLNIFLNRRSYKNSGFILLTLTPSGLQLYLPCANDLQLQKCSCRSCFTFIFVLGTSCQSLHSQSTEICNVDLLFRSKIVIFEVESFL